MKIRFTFKDPDTVIEAIEEAVIASIPDNITDRAERAALIETHMCRESNKVAQWFEWSEYVRIEVDTDAGTATVLPAKER